ncbi:hypothetical protein BDF20DRAFT_985815 [Mycotypha africana]|uniref:uncharacterized protein n=1 Tax=Mycotypha africana TaxID=64632 RepID=UPI002300562D|nr:uncharacterized protein BDF20DRAFT_985815 [Mycotypha africana]KAI8988530.1 hypothetical protein BDF20DRAFT_985815 [Mycotypha africana]
MVYACYECVFVNRCFAVQKAYVCFPYHIKCLTWKELALAAVIARRHVYYGNVFFFFVGLAILDLHLEPNCFKYGHHIDSSVYVSLPSLQTLLGVKSAGTHESRSINDLHIIEETEAACLQVLNSSIVTTINQPSTSRFYKVADSSFTTQYLCPFNLTASLTKHSCIKHNQWYHFGGPKYSLDFHFSALLTIINQWMRLNRSLC